MCSFWGCGNRGVWPKGEYAPAVSRLELPNLVQQRLVIRVTRGVPSKDSRLRPVRSTLHQFASGCYAPALHGVMLIR